MAGQIEYIRSFLAVTAQGGFAAAARSLGLSPTIVTRHIAELETQLGVQLFTRTTRKVDLTNAGRLYRDRIATVVDDLDAANTAVRNRQVGLSGPLTISAPMSFGTRFLPEIIAQFRILHPAVAINLQLTDRFVGIAEEGFDMALRISEPPQDQKTLWRKICPITRAMVATSEYLARHDPITAPDALATHDCLHYADTPGTPVWRLARGHQHAAVTLDPCLISNNGDLIARLAALSEGIALLPTFIVQNSLDAGHLHCVLPDWQAPDIWLSAAFPPYDTLPAKVAAFTRFVEAQMAPPA